jgi:spore germination cell wall hydrolase CwlJ-like protein
MSLRPSVRITACLSALLLLANCAQTTSPTAMAPAEVTGPATKASRADTDDIACLAEAVYFEARGTSEKGQKAVAHVVVNRANSPKFPDSVCAVVADKCQFSYRCDGRPDVLANARDRQRAMDLARQVLGGASDITQGALFFHAESAEPGWFNTRPRVGTFGGNVFYR